MSNFLIFLKGMFVGIANIIPGLSGGTVAVILGIYEQLIEALSNILKFKYDVFRVSFIFLFFVILGAIIGVFSFSFLIDWLSTNFKEPLSYFFIGVLVSSIPYIVKKESIKLFKLSNVLVCLIFVLFGFVLIYLNQDIVLGVESEVTDFYLFLSSFVAASTMIIPGISGSLVLVLFGTYSFVISAIKSLDISTLLIVAISSSVGILSTSFFIKKALDNYFNRTMSAIVGLMIGTIPGLYVGFSSSLFVYNFLFLFLGVSLVWVFDYFNS